MRRNEQESFMFKLGTVRPEKLFLYFKSGLFIAIEYSNIINYFKPNFFNFPKRRI